MESGYRIGRVEDAYWETNSDGKRILNYLDDRNNRYESDNGDFEDWLSKELGEPFQSNGLPDFGCTWIVDNETLFDVISRYNLEVERKQSAFRHPVFTDLLNWLEEGDYYVVWVDWS